MASTTVFQTVGPGSNPGFRSIFLLIVFVLIGCAGHSPNRIEMDNRILMKRADREYQAKTFGYLGARPSAEVRNAFLEGWVINGMGESMVFDMYGEPDRLIVYSKNEKDWIYMNSHGYEMSRVTFIDNIVANVQGYLKLRRQAP